MRTTDRQKVWIAPALLFLATHLLQPVPTAFADVSVQDKEVLEAVEKVAPTVEEIAKKLWDLSEVSLLEVKSSAYLKDLLKKSGFTTWLSVVKASRSLSSPAATPVAGSTTAESSSLASEGAGKCGRKRSRTRS